MAIGLVQRLNNRFFKLSRTGKSLLLSSLAGVAGGTLFFSLESNRAAAFELIAHPPKLDWAHSKYPFNSYDHASIRRGWQVYKQVCAACHSLKYVHYRDMVNVFLTEAEAKAEAEEVMVQDGPNDRGEMFMRPGRLSDHVPSPYPNEEAAAAANNGAYPPDLSLIVIARDGGEDYIFSLLTGYIEPPAGYQLDENQHFNPYFPDGAISMAQALYDEVVEYSDGTPASASQLAKDVASFLTWSSMSEHDERKLMAMKFFMIAIPMTAAFYYWKRHTWVQLKTRKISLRPPSS